MNLPRQAARTLVNYLDSVRGIAATIRSISALPADVHAVQRGAVPRNSRGFLGPHRGAALSVLCDGRSAVLIFFALSGFVLALMLSGRRTSYAAFAVKRFCRIYLPYAVAIGVALLLMSLLSNRRIGGTSFWFNLSWSQPVSARLIAHQAFMTGQLDIVDNPIWSLVHELRVSLIFPLLLLLVGRIRASILLPALLTLPVIAPVPIHAMRQHWGCRRRWKRRVICSFLPPAPFWPLIEPLYRLTSSRRAGR
jgi:peptidoglycan/LPS O-acetylase OafA/YrhL